MKRARTFGNKGSGEPRRFVAQGLGQRSKIGSRLESRLVASPVVADQSGQSRAGFRPAVPAYSREQRRKRSSAYDLVYQRFRRWFLSLHVWCEDCRARGKYRPAREVHHTVKVHEDESRKCDPVICVALCKRCHSRRTARGE